MLKRLAPVLALAVLAACLPGCSTNTQGDDASPEFLTVTFDGVPVRTNVATQSPLQIQSTVYSAVLKNPSGGSSSFLDVRLDDYTVTWRRLDGGTLVPAPETFGIAANGVLPAGGSQTVTNQMYLTATAIQRTPLDRLFPFNGGFDAETGKSEIRMVAIVTVRGHTLSGQPVSGTGSFNADFYYAALAARQSSK